MEKPDVDSVEGLSPAVAIEQKNPTKTSRSTVGTGHGDLRLPAPALGSRRDTPFVRLRQGDKAGHGAVGDRHSPALQAGTRFYVTFPLKLSSKVTHEVVIENLQAQGFLRVAVDGTCCTWTRLPPRSATITRAEGSCWS